MSRSTVVRSSGGNLKAIAQRGARDVNPSCTRWREVVDLDDHAVDLVRQVVAVLLPVPGRTRRRRRRRRPRGSPGSPGSRASPRNVERLVMAGELGPADHLAQLVAPEAQLAARGDRAGPSGAGCRPPRCAGWRTAAARRLPARSFSASKLAIGMYTSPRTSSTSGAPSRQSLGQRRDRGDVGGDVLADATVAARRRLHELAVLVAQAHRQARRSSARRRTRRGAPPRPRATRSPHCAKLALVHGVVEAGHRDAMDRPERTSPTMAPAPTLGSANPP